MTTININGSSNPSNAAATHYADAHHKISPGAKASDKSLPAEISADAVDNGAPASSDASSSSVGASSGEESFSCNEETVADDGNAMVSAANAREEDMATNQLDVEDMATNQPNIEEISLESIYQCSDILKLSDIYCKLLKNENASSHLTNEARKKLIELHLLSKAADAAGAEQLATDDPSFTLQEPRHNTAKDAIPEEESSQKNPFYFGDFFNNHVFWPIVGTTAEKFSEGCEYFTGDVLPGDSHARDASDIKVVCIHGFPVPGLERMMQLNLTKDGLENTSLDQSFRNIVTRLKEDDGYGMSHDKAVDLALGGVAFIDAIAAVGDWDLRSDKHKKKHFKKLTEELGLRELMRVIIIDVLKMLPNLEKIYAMGAEGFIMLDLIRSEFPDQITQEETIMHGMQLSNGWADEYQAKKYLGMIDEIAAILSGEDAKGFKNLEHMRKYITIGKDRNARYSIRSIDDETPLGIARSLAMIAKWTSTDIETIRRSLKRNDGFLSVNGKLLYRLTIVSNDVAVGMTVAGVAAFEIKERCGLYEEIVIANAETKENAEKKEKAIVMMQEDEPGWKFPSCLYWHKRSQSWELRRSVNGKLRSLGCYPNTIEGLQMAATVAGRFDAEYTEEFKAAITEANVEEKMREIKERCKLNVKPPSKKRKAGKISNAEAKKIANAMMQDVEPGWEFPSGLNWIKSRGKWSLQKGFKHKGFNGKSISLGCYPNTIEGLQMAATVAGRFDVEYNKEFKATITEGNVEEKMNEIKERCMGEQGQDCASDLCEELNVKPPAKKRKAGKSVTAGKKEKANAMMQDVEPGWKCPKGLNWINSNGSWSLQKGFNGKSVSLGCYPNTIEGLQMAATVAGRFVAEYTEEFKATITEENMEEKMNEIKKRCMGEQGQDCASDLCEELNVKPPAKKKVKVAQNEEDGDE